MSLVVKVLSGYIKDHFTLRTTSILPFIVTSESEEAFVLCHPI